MNGHSKEGFREEVAGKKGREDISGVHRAGIGCGVSAWLEGRALSSGHSRRSREGKEEEEDSVVHWLLPSAQHTRDCLWYLQN